jgi:peroxiredoxin
MGFMGQWNVKPFLTQAGNILQIVLPGIRANLGYAQKRWISLLVMCPETRQMLALSQID